MPEFSIKSIRATIGDWHWSGFASAEDHHLRDHRTVHLRGGPTWAWREPVEPEWQLSVGVVERIAAAAIEGAWCARHQAEGAAHAAAHGRFRALDLPTAASLRERHDAPRCRVTLHEIRIELADAWQGGALQVSGASALPTIRCDRGVEATTVPPALFRAARHGHRLAFRSAAAALTDAAAQLGHHVATTEGALQTVDAELGFVTA